METNPSPATVQEHCFLNRRWWRVLPGKIIGDFFLVLFPRLPIWTRAHHTHGGWGDTLAAVLPTRGLSTSQKKVCLPKCLLTGALLGSPQAPPQPLLSRLVVPVPPPMPTRAWAPGSASGFPCMLALCAQCTPGGAIPERLSCYFHNAVPVGWWACAVFSPPAWIPPAQL